MARKSKRKKAAVIIRDCSWCGKKFEARRAHAVTCSAACRKNESRLSIADRAARQAALFKKVK